MVLMGLWDMRRRSTKAPAPAREKLTTTRPMVRCSVSINPTQSLMLFAKTPRSQLGAVPAQPEDKTQIVIDQQNSRVHGNL